MSLRVDRLQKLREERGWSQRELARRCGLGQTMIRKYETQQTEPTTSSLKQVSAILDVSTDYLLGITDDPRGHLGDGQLSDEEQAIVNTFRHEGWPGVIKLGGERLSR